MDENAPATMEVLEIDAVAAHADSRTYRTYPFEVPLGTTALALTFDVDPKQVGLYSQAMDLALYSPSGFRGAPGRGVRPARIAIDGATPGFLPGRIEPGTWVAQVCLVYVLDGPPCSYRLRIWTEDKASREEVVPSTSLPQAVPHTGPGWYAGDLHMHTHHSDGQWSVEELWHAVQQRKLDFFVLTDHNNLSGLAALSALDTRTILPIPGIEVTTMYGHLVGVGVETLIDWRINYRDRTIADIVRDVHAVGGVAIVAHPGAEPSPACHGCRWDFSDTDPRTIDAVEVWNGPWSGGNVEDNERGLAFWKEWGTQGHCVSLSGGSDEHGDESTFPPGVPTTYVYAHELSRAAILEGIRAGRIVVSSGPVLRFVGRAGAVSGGPGTTLPSQGPFVLEATVSGLDVPARLCLLGNGSILTEKVLHGAGACTFECGRPVGGWYHAELRDLDGSAMMAIASPLFIEA